MNENPYLKRLDEMEEARKRWKESEWVLGFLRTETGTPSPQPTDEEIRAWFLQHRQFRI